MRITAVEVSEQPLAHPFGWQHGLPGSGPDELAECAGPRHRDPPLGLHQLGVFALRRNGQPEQCGAPNERRDQRVEGVVIARAEPEVLVN